jgi:hypothetical protein
MPFRGQIPQLLNKMAQQYNMGPGHVLYYTATVAEKCFCFLHQRARKSHAFVVVVVAEWACHEILYTVYIYMRKPCLRSLDCVTHTKMDTKAAIHSHQYLWKKQHYCTGMAVGDQNLSLKASIILDISP